MNEGQYISTDYLETFYFVWIIYVSEILYYIYSPICRIKSGIGKFMKF